jgi:hypothetical protein
MVPSLHQDRYLAPDLRAAATCIAGRLARCRRPGVVPMNLIEIVKRGDSPLCWACLIPARKFPTIALRG